MSALARTASGLPFAPGRQRLSQSACFPRKLGVQYSLCYPRDEDFSATAADYDAEQFRCSSTEIVIIDDVAKATASKSVLSEKFRVVKLTKRICLIIFRMLELDLLRGVAVAVAPFAFGLTIALCAKSFVGPVGKIAGECACHR
jgi:hypothetical protein